MTDDEIAPKCTQRNCDYVLQNCDNAQLSHIPLAGYCSGIGDLPMRMFETVTSTMLAIAAQALVVGVVITAF